MKKSVGIYTIKILNEEERTIELTNTENGNTEIFEFDEMAETPEEALEMLEEHLLEGIELEEEILLDNAWENIEIKLKEEGCEVKRDKFDIEIKYDFNMSSYEKYGCEIDDMGDISVSPETYLLEGLIKASFEGGKWEVDSYIDNIFSCQEDKDNGGDWEGFQIDWEDGIKYYNGDIVQYLNKIIELVGSVRMIEPQEKIEKTWSVETDPGNIYTSSILHIGSRGEDLFFEESSYHQEHNHLNKKSIYWTSIDALDIEKWREFLDEEQLKQIEDSL